MGETLAAVDAGRRLEAYPPAPWWLAGNAHAHLLVVRPARLPDVPDGFRPLVFGGFGLVVAG